MSDCVGEGATTIETKRRSRALAAFALADRLGVSPQIACADVVDGFDDHGIDAIGIDGDTVVLVQSKFDNRGNGSPAQGDVGKFVQGVRDLLIPRLDRFNARVQAKQTEILHALDNADTEFALIFAHTGSQPLSSHAQQLIDDLLDEQNDAAEILTFVHLDQAALHAMVKQSIGGNAPDLSVTLYDWGKTTDPYEAYYGQVDASDVADWWASHRTTLFDSNLRKFKHDSKVNEALVNTLLVDPEKFWYFNNGITVLCERIAKKPVGGGGRKSGKFDFGKATVVNGAQTVGSIGVAAGRDPAKVADARIHARFISLEHCPDGFSSDVTRATNTQNRVDRRDFVSLDPEQERLRSELQLEQSKVYAVKTGEPDPRPEHGCTVVDATIALACAHSVELAVLAKREIGRLWEEVGQDPYQQIFPPQLSATKLWHAVQVLRTVEAKLDAERSALDGRDRQISVHANRLITHRVFTELAPGTLDADEATFASELSRVDGLTKEALDGVTREMAAHYSTNYVPPLFKNLTKCRDLLARL
jgi:hypothetical protein